MANALAIRRLSRQRPEDRAHRRGVEGHELEGQCDQLIRPGGHAAQVQVFEDVRVRGEEHVMHREGLALPRIDRRRIDA
jgi:hypothetical protein